ncbi:ABC transporter ATP-binding protein [Paenibacillus antri]|uniref:ABC transporter ATP-binding protein n=1 Tax=Paenibacillus antri TaxID=2582848 RepID=A0A5R9GCS9_9BACL|nr:ABC transporter ATP-binding protein [Paenibacillus antri]TLS49185.1 ABC transporter ATP-binding protein [Paenibacillus antri]
MVVLQAERLSKTYGRGAVTYQALENFDLTVEEGEFVGVMGPSGSGKTTLLNLLATIDKPTAGAIRVGGVDPSRMSASELALFRRRKLGFIFQDFNLLDTLTMKENIILPLALDKTKPKEIERRVVELAEMLGIAHTLDKRTYEVSGGQLQRAAIARAFIHEPDIVLADELTGNLDSKAAGDVMEALRDMNERRRATVLMVTHDPFAASFCKRILFIKDGRRFAELRGGGGGRQAFFQEILDMLSVLGGHAHDVSRSRHP